MRSERLRINCQTNFEEPIFLFDPSLVQKKTFFSQDIESHKKQPHFRCNEALKKGTCLIKNYYNNPCTDIPGSLVVKLFVECLFGLLWKDHSVAEGLLVRLKLEPKGALKDLASKPPPPHCAAEVLRPLNVFNLK